MCSYVADFEQRWEYWPSKRFASSPSGTFDTINLSFESRLNAPSLWRLQRTAKGSFSLGSDALRGASQKLELDAQCTSNVPDFEKLGLKFNYERTSSGARSTAELLVPGKLKHPDQRSSANAPPMKLTLEVTRPESTQGTFTATLTQPFAFVWQTPSSAYSHVEFKNEYNLAASPFKVESEMTLTPGSGGGGVKQFRFVTEMRLADWSTDRFGLSDSSAVDLLFLYARYLKQLKVSGRSNVRGLERYEVTLANELLSDGGLKLKTEIAAHVGVIRYKYSQSLTRQLPSSNSVYPLQANATLVKESVDFSLSLLTAKLAIARNSSEIAVDVNTDGNAEGWRYKFAAEQTYEVSNLKGSLELQRVSGSGSAPEKVLGCSYSLQESRGSRLNWRASAQYLTNRASFDWLFDPRARKLLQKFVYTESNSTKLKHELKVDVYVPSEDRQQTGIDLKYEFLNEKFDQLSVRRAILKHMHLTTWSAPLGLDHQKRGMNLVHQTELSVNDRTFLLLESPCAIELELPNIRIELGNANVRSDSLSISYALNGVRFASTYSNASKEYRLELVGVARDLRPNNNNNNNGNVHEKNVSLNAGLTYRYGSGISFTSYASLNHTNGALGDLLPGALLLRTEATIDPFRVDVDQPHVVLFSEMVTNGVEKLHGRATFQFADAEQPLDKPYLFLWNSAFRGMYHYPLGLNINTSNLISM